MSERRVAVPSGQGSEASRSCVSAPNYVMRQFEFGLVLHLSPGIPRQMESGGFCVLKYPDRYLT